MSRTRPIRDLGLAITLMTAIPLRVKVPAEGERRDVAGWLPLIGLVFGIAFAGVAILSERYLYGFSFTGAAIVLFLMAVATRFLHWDGLADVADAWFVPVDRRLDVLADTHIGAFGATAIVFAALIELSAVLDLSVTAQGAALLVLAPTFGRAAATFAAWLGKPARPGGLGSSVMGAPSFRGLIAAVGAAGASLWVAHAVGAEIVPLMIVAALAFLMAAGVPHLIALRFGGVTGDVMGASVIVTEVSVLVAAAAVIGILRLIGVAS